MKHYQYCPDCLLESVEDTNTELIRNRIGTDGWGQPCEQCGNPVADKHHDDYSKPLEYRWLCRKCHIAFHVEQYGSWGEGLKQQ